MLTYSSDQSISDPTNILPGSSSCINPIFTDQPKLVIKQWCSSFLHANCHHQMTYCNLNIMVVYPLPYERLVRDYTRADKSSINTAGNKLDQDFLFTNNSVSQQVIIFSRTVMNVFPNVAPNKFVTFNDIIPPGTTSNIKDKIN